MRTIYGLMIALIIVFAATAVTVYSSSSSTVQFTSELHEVSCMAESGEYGVFLISIPTEVRNLDYYTEGYCKSIGY